MEIDSTTRRTEKRNRPPVSCEPCRTRKLKCNRGMPCESCVRRDKAASCTYAGNAARSGGRAAKQARPRDLKDKLASLEDLVSAFLAEPSGPPAADAVLDVESTAEQFSRTALSINLVDRETATDTAVQGTPDSTRRAVSHIDPSHWLSILEDIKEVREHLDETASESTAPSTSKSASDYDTGGSDPSLVLGTGQLSRTAVTLDGIIAGLPARPVCDMLLSWYFNSQFMVLGVVHPAKFQTEYEQFWTSPSTTSLLWTALLFAILSITCCLRHISGLAGNDDAALALPPVSALQYNTLQCLVLGHYATADAHALEAFVLHLQSTFMSHNIASASRTSARHCNDNNTALTEAWFLMGTVIRLAFRMGYHRDDSPGKEADPFDAEMRRRVWLNVFQIDALMSFQIGLPSMIPQEACDTKVPRNLEHTDLKPGMAALPAGRPLSEYTPMLYTIVKASVMAVFKKITAHTLTTGVLSSEMVQRTQALDAEMRNVYAGVPELMRGRDMGRSGIMDSGCLICQRATIEILYLKGLVVLHRRYVTYHGEEGAPPLYAVFRQACVSAALDILARHADLHAACSPGGRLYQDRRMALCSVPASDYLLAAMVVCLDLSVRMRRVQPRDYDGGPSGGGVEDSRLSAREYEALQTSQRIYAASSSVFPDAKIAAQVLDLMIRKVAENDIGAAGQGSQLSLDESYATILSGHNTIGWDFSPHNFSDDAVDPSQLSYAIPMSLMIDGSENIDWGLLDQYLQNINPAVQE